VIARPHQSVARSPERRRLAVVLPFRLVTSASVRLASSSSPTGDNPNHHVAQRESYPPHPSSSSLRISPLTSEDWEKYKKFADDEDPNANKKITPLDEGDIQLLKTYGQGPYARALKKIDDEIKEVSKRVNDKIGVKESDMGLAPPNLWDLFSDRQRMSEEHPLQVARCTKIIQNPDDPEKAKYVINVKQIAKFGTASLHSPSCGFVLGVCSDE
jgi:hypothetical protein